MNVAHQEIDVHNPKGSKKCAGFTPQEREEFSKLLEEGWVDTFRQLHPEEVKYSYFSAKNNAKAENKGWRLDYFAVNKEAMPAVIDSDIDVSVPGSDHQPVELKLDLTKL